MDPGSLDELPIFFVVGRGRSGSTLLRSLFDAHPHVMIPLESRFVQFLYYNYPSKKRWLPGTAQRAILDLEHGFEPPKLNRTNLEKQVESLSPDLSFRKVCKLIYLNTFSEFPKERIHAIGDKNPRYTFFIPQLLKLFPNARFIHLVRDYRDNIVSVQRTGRLINESGNIYFALGRWSLYNRYVVKYQKRYPDRFCRVKFEELIKDPGTVMKNLCSFLGIDFDPEMLNYHDRVGKYLGEEAFSALHKSLQTPFDLSKVGEWEEVLPVHKAIRCEVLAGSFPEKFGYHPKYSINLLRRTSIYLIFYPLVLLGQFRFFLKILFYGWRPVMRMAYRILLKIK
jgi:hypothetical protein